MMLTYGPDSYSSQAWLENDAETYSFGEKARALHILSRKLEWMARGETRSNSSGRFLSQVCSHDLSADSSQLHSPSGCPTHSRSRSVFRSPQWDGCHESSASSAYSYSTAKESHTGLGRGSEDEAGSTAGNMLVHEEDVGSADKGYGNGTSGSDNLESEDESEGEGSNQAGSGSECGESCSDNEESGSGSGSGSSAPESEEETPKTKPDKLPPEASSEADPNALQTISIPEVNDKDSEGEWRNNCCNFAHSQDVDFGQWRDCMISEGHKEWAKQDKMTCDHADPNKKVKHPDPHGVPIAYMESR